MLKLNLNRLIKWAPERKRNTCILQTDESVIGRCLYVVNDDKKSGMNYLLGCL